MPASTRPPSSGAPPPGAAPPPRPPEEQAAIDAFLEWRRAKPGHLLTDTHVDQYLKTSGAGDDVGRVLRAHVAAENAARAQRLGSVATASRAAVAAREAAAGRVVARFVGACVLVVIGIVAAYLHGRYDAARDCEAFSDEVAAERGCVGGRLATPDVIAARARGIGARHGIDVAAGGVRVTLEELSFGHIDRLPPDERHNVGLGSEGPNPYSFLGVEVEGRARRFLGTHDCAFTRNMRVVR